MRSIYPCRLLTESRKDTIVEMRKTTENHFQYFSRTSFIENNRWKLTDLMLLPTVDPIDSARSRINRKTICTLTCRSTAVLLIGAALCSESRSVRPEPSYNYLITHVAFRISFVSCPVKTTIPYSHGVFLICAPRNSIWSGPKGIVFGTPISLVSSSVPS